MKVVPQGGTGCGCAKYPLAPIHFGRRSAYPFRQKPVDPVLWRIPIGIAKEHVRPGSAKKASELLERGHRDERIETLFYDNPCLFLGRRAKFRPRPSRSRREAWSV